MELLAGQWVDYSHRSNHKRGIAVKASPDETRVVVVYRDGKGRRCTDFPHRHQITPIRIAAMGECIDVVNYVPTGYGEPL